MSFILSAFASGLIFGLGLIVSQMINPAKVLSFLDLFGNWDPSLALVMFGAVAASALSYAVARRSAFPLLASKFDVPTRRDLDASLLAGATIFGVGWGLAGLCPGPALALLPLGHWQVFVFVAAMLVGMTAHRFAARAWASPASSSASAY